MLDLGFFTFREISTLCIQVNYLLERKIYHFTSENYDATYEISRMYDK